MDYHPSQPPTTIPLNPSALVDHAPSTTTGPATKPTTETAGTLVPNQKPLDTSAANGVVSTTSQVSDEKPVAEPRTDKDTEIKEQPAPPEPVPTEPADKKEPETPAQPARQTNGTPALSKKASNSKRKSTGGVPEHKTKKLNKKKSQQKITHLDAKPGEYYFARLKSYPPWPSIICDEEMLPQTLLSTRPVTTKQADGTYKEAYADGGKRAHERTFPVMFLHTNELSVTFCPAVYIDTDTDTDTDGGQCLDPKQRPRSSRALRPHRCG